MARALNLAEQTYPAGAYGPFTVDTFTEADTEAVMVKFTQPPTGFPPYQITAGFDGCNPSSVSYGGGIARDKGGVPLAFGYLKIDVPKEADGRGGKRKRTVRSATVTVVLGGLLTTAINVEAI